MRHGKRFNHLGRTSSHRKSMLSNMASSLILNKKIETTLAKGKALRKYIEPLITKSKSDTTHSRRSVFSYLQNKDSVNELFGGISEKIADRPTEFPGFGRTCVTETCLVGPEGTCLDVPGGTCLDVPGGTCLAVPGRSMSSCSRRIVHDDHA